MVGVCQFGQALLGSGLIIKSDYQEAVAVVILAPEFKALALTQGVPAW